MAGTQRMTKYGNLRQLRDDLRAPLPEMFEWDMRFVGGWPNECGAAGCAIGLLRWKGLIRDANEVAGLLNLEESEIDRLFYPDSAPHAWKAYRSVVGKHVTDSDEAFAKITPAHVADAIDAFLLSKGETP